jgi:hypothetical protein
MMVMHSYRTRNRSKLIEERIESAKQKAKESLNAYAYSTILEELYKLTKKKAPEVLPRLEEIVEKTDLFSDFGMSVLAIIRDYIRDYIPPIKQYYRRERLRLPTYKKVHNPKEGLEYLTDVLRAFGNYAKNNLSYIGKLIWNNVYSKTNIYRITSSYREKIQNLEKGLEYLMMPDVWDVLFEMYSGIRSAKLIPLYARDKVAYDYLRSDIVCLLSNPDRYIQWPFC